MGQFWDSTNSVKHTACKTQIIQPEGFVTHFDAHKRHSVKLFAE